jgi:hypothetical protein
MTEKMVRAKKGEAQSPEPKWSCHQNLRSVHLNQRLLFVIWSFRFSVPNCGYRAAYIWIGRPLWCGDTDTATKSRDESASLGVGRNGEFDLDSDRLAVVPLTETVQAIGEIFERCVLRHMNESAPSSKATVTRLGRDS